MARIGTTLQQQRDYVRYQSSVEYPDRLGTAIYTLDILGDAADGVQEVPSPNSIGVSLFAAVAGEHIGREIGLQEGEGGKIAAVFADCLVE
jgi:hypothetical protein